ncbi:MAG TPA: outer membrane protein assembly factor BamA [Myxococcaceae bacterium]|nr:outer membrane protein assembly factor BamA [Myxococcaceae bacterium]
MFGAPTTIERGPPNPERIIEVRVEGNRRVEPDAIKRALKNQEGQIFDHEKTGDDLRSLWSLNYFSDIQLLVQRTDRGIIYLVRVTERPAIRDVKLQGNEELSKDDFKEAIDLKSYSILDLDAVRRNEKKIQEKYVEKGFFLAEVTHKIEPVAGTNEVDVVFVIHEHSKVMVKEISLLGAIKVPADELKGTMFTREGGYLSFITGEGTFREEIFQRDLSILQAAYYDRGFINVKIEKPQVSISSDKRYIYISIKIEEGEAYTIGKLDFSGDLLVAKPTLKGLMTSRQGELFNRTKLSHDISTLTDLYLDQGYAYANITPLTQLHTEQRLVDLTFDVQKGHQVYIERIDISGNTKTRDKVVRREMRVYEGELFSGTGERRSKERVTALGFFETVEVQHKPGSDDSKVIVTVEVKEKATGTFQVGLGFSNVENFIFTAQVAQNNLLGWGQTASFSAQISSLRSFFQLSFFDPYFFDTNYIFSIDLFRIQADYGGFLRNSTGGDVNLGYHFFEDVIGNVTYTREYISVEPSRTFNSIPLANRLRGSGTTSSVRFSLQWDRRNNRLFPTKGSILFGSAEIAPSWLGSTFQFTRYSAYGRYYWPLFWGFVFKVNATFGIIQSLNPSSPVPISELYYLGGINSIRGYALRSISPTILVPRDNSPEGPVDAFPVGGNKQAIFNFELEFPIIEKVGIKGVVFYDMGNAFAVNANFFQDKQYNLPFGMFTSVGFGFRWFSPVGPLRFEWGFPLNRRPGIDQSSLFEFTIGNFF